MGIFTSVGMAVNDANELARKESLRRPERLVAVVTHDPNGVFLSWTTVEQVLRANEVEAGWWQAGRKL
jgi:hypothetical protein